MLLLFIPAYAWHFPWQQTRTWRIILAPAGDAQQPGRPINDTFERNLTLQWAEELKKALEQTISSVTVTISRMPGEQTHPLGVAHMANRFNADLVISLHCYQEHRAKSSVYVYHFSYGNEFITALPEFHVYPIDQAYLAQAPVTSQWATHLTTALQQSPLSSSVHIMGPFSLPLQPLLGIKSPAIALELGIKHTMHWQPLITALVTALKTWIESH